MKRRKQDSKRRWKARLRLDRYIPLEAVYNHRLERLAAFEEHPLNRTVRLA